jgi:hypothetical protein
MIMKSPLVATQTLPNIAVEQQNRFSKWIRAVPAQNDWLKGEPHLREMLTDPIVRLVMRRDNLGPADVWAAVEQARAGLHGPQDSPRKVA